MALKSPKGTTIRRNLEQVEGIQYIFAKNYSTYNDSAPLVEDLILNGSDKKSILVFELHATTSPSFFKMRRRLQRWRATALRNRVPVFFFSLVREPIAVSIDETSPFASSFFATDTLSLSQYSFSHFNFFHLQKRNPTFERCNATERDFLRKSIYNPQVNNTRYMNPRGTAPLLIFYLGLFNANFFYLLLIYSHLVSISVPR